MERKLELPELFEEFEEGRKNGFLSVKKQREEGTPLIGVYCTFFPLEIAMALDIQTVSLCSFSNETIADAEKDLPANLCPLIKSSYGFGKMQKCPYFYFADLIVGETTCDGKKKMYELMSEFKDVYVMELPNRASEAGYKLWVSEIRRFAKYAEERFGRTLTEENLWAAIRKKNRERAAMNKFSALMSLDPPPMTSRELWSVLYGSKFTVLGEDLPEQVDYVAERVTEEYDPSVLPKKPRILVTGCPIGGDTEKIIDAIENNGGIAVAFENCGGAKAIHDLVDEENPDPFDALARKYLAIGCSCMTPNPGRIRLLDEMISRFKVDGVIEMLLHACHTYHVEAKEIERFCQDEKNVAYMSVSTDYSNADIGQLNTRIAAFIEMLR